MIWNIVRRLRYKPAKVAREDPRISAAPTANVLGAARFDFRHEGGRVVLGADSIVDCEFIFESDAGVISVGERSYVGGGTRLISRSGISIGKDVMIGWNCYLYDHDSHSVDWRNRAADMQAQLRAHRAGLPLTHGKDWSTVVTAPVRVCDKAWIGFDSVILKGVEVGEGAIVAARSVVVKNVPPWTVVAGNPAIVVRAASPELSERLGR